MRVKSPVRALLVLAALCLVGFRAKAQEQSPAQQAGGDPLAEAARKTREEKKNAAKPKKVYTDDDVKSAPTATSSSGSNGAAANGPAAGGTGQPNADDGKPQEDPNGEKAWRRRFQAQREKIAKAEQEVSVLQREVDKDQVQYYPDPQKALAEQNTRSDINDKKTKIDIKQKELAHLKQGLADLEDQLRKTGGDPGWAR